MRKFSVAFFALVFASIAQAEISAGGLVEHRHAVADGATLEFAIFSMKNATLRVIDEPTGNHSLGEIMMREKCLAGTNGGYFDPEFAPVGLSISDGRLVRPFQKAKLLSGVVSASGGRVLIQWAAEFSMKSKPQNARQCGPFLVEAGRPVANLNHDRAARRTFVAVSGDRAMLGFCSPVTLGQLAEILAASEFKISRALNLDGGSSSAFWFARADGAFYISEQKNVRDFLAIVPK